MVKFALAHSWGNYLEIVQEFYWIANLVYILGLGWISCNMGEMWAMLSAFFKFDFESEFDSESELCFGDMKVYGNT